MRGLKVCFLNTITLQNFKWDLVCGGINWKIGNDIYTPLYI